MSIILIKSCYGVGTIQYVLFCIVEIFKYGH